MKRIITITILCLGAIAMYGQPPALKVAADSNVGIGTATPTQSLHIERTGAPASMLTSRTDGIANFFKATAGAAGSAFLFNQAAFIAISPAASSASTSITAANSLVVRGTGNVGIGTTAPTHKLHVAGDIKYDGALVPSDKRLKNNISDFKRGLNEVLELNPISFDYNGLGGSTAGRHTIGILAQDLQKVVPEFVSEYVFEDMGSVTDLEAGLKSKSSESYLQVKDNEIKWMLVNAIKDQQSIIEEKEVRITALEEKLVQLERAVTSILDSKETTISDVDLTGSKSYLAQNVPNPFKGNTAINYEIPTDASSAEVNVYSMNGKLLKNIQIQHVGKGSLNINSSELPSGTYSYQLIVDGNVVGTEKMVRAN